MKPLDSLAKRDLLAAEKFDPEEIRERADAFFADKRYSDALDFYQKLSDKNGVRRIKEAAIVLGNTDLLWRIEHRDEESVTKADWTACGEGAMRLEKFRAAAYAFERAGNAERLAAAEREFKPQEEEAGPAEEK